jgi:hypothetical protein
MEMASITKEIMSMAFDKAKENMYTQMEISTMGSLRKIKSMGSAGCHIRIKESTMVSIN